MKISNQAAELLATLLDLQAACAGGLTGSIEQLAARCETSAIELSAADLAGCDQEARAKLRRTAMATAAFLRRVVRWRGMRLTMRRFTEVESSARRKIAI